MNPESHERPLQFNFEKVQESFPELGENLQDVFFSVFFWLQVVSLFASLFLLIGIIYSVIKIKQIRSSEAEAFKKAAQDTPGSAPSVTDINPDWERVVELSESENEADWRLAIIEADIMLDGMLKRMQYPGETLGEKLKQVEKSDFNTIDNAWEAHKIRNQITHEGSDFVLSKREVDRTIRLYESVFKEFHFT